MLINRKAVRNLVIIQGLKKPASDSPFLALLDKKVNEIVIMACDIAKKNGQKRIKTLE